MERLKFANKRIMLVFGLLFVTGIIGCMVPVSVAKIHHIPAFAYITMILIWAVTVRRRIVDGRIRTRILIACAFMLLLFILRMCKYSYFPDDIYVNEYVWYAYTIPLTGIPACFFMAAINVEPVRNPRLVAATEKALIVLNVIVAVVVMTNDYHSFVYNITVHGRIHREASYYQHASEVRLPQPPGAGPHGQTLRYRHRREKFRSVNIKPLKSAYQIF